MDRRWAAAVCALSISVLLAGDGSPRITFWHVVTMSFQCCADIISAFAYFRHGDVKHDCTDESPFMLWAWKRYEDAVGRKAPFATDPVPVIEVPADIGSGEEQERILCSQIVQKFGGWGSRPFIVRGLGGMHLLDDNESWSLQTFAKFAPEEIVRANGVDACGIKAERNRQCSLGRPVSWCDALLKNVAAGVNESIRSWHISFAKVSVTDSQVSSLQASAAESVPEQNSPRSAYVRRLTRAERLWTLCTAEGMPGRSFVGRSGEASFVFSKKGVEENSRDTVVHATYKRSFFFQIHGRQRWRMWSPGLSQLLRPRGFFGSLSGTFYHQRRNVAIHPQALGDSGLLAPDSGVTPSMGADTGPGDMVFVPPWWWHDADGLGGKSVGVLARGKDWPGGSYWHLPVVRFLWQWNTLDAILLDAFQLAPTCLRSLVVGQSQSSSAD